MLGPVDSYTVEMSSRPWPTTHGKFPDKLLPFPMQLHFFMYPSLQDQADQQPRLFSLPLGSSETSHLPPSMAQTINHLPTVRETPGWEKFPGEENDYPFQYSCVENSMDR